MYKYFAYCAFFFLFILVSFWVFAWKWRTEILTSFLDRTCPPYKAHIESVSWKNSRTLKITGIQLQDINGHTVLDIAEARLKTSFSSWMYWFLVPSKKPLFLSQVVLNVRTLTKCSFNVPQTPFFILIDKVILIDPKGNKHTHLKQSGLFSEIFLELFDHS